MMYDGQGHLVQIPQTPAPVAATVPATTNTSDMTGNAGSYGDLLKSISDNIGAYTQNSQANAAETAAQNAYIQAVQNAQNYQLSLTQGELGQYGIGRPLSLDTGRAAQIGFNNQLNTQNFQNAETLAQNQEQYQQGQQNIRVQSGATALNADLGIAGLAKPVAASPGSSYIDPVTGQTVSQGNNFQAPTASDVISLGTALFQNGGFSDITSAINYAAQNFQSLMGGQSSGDGSNTTTHPNSTVPVQNGNAVLGYDIGNYATNPNNVQQVAAIAQNIPQLTTPSQIQQYINQVAPNSPITGQMVYNASTSNGVDSRMMLAVMQNESQFGTQGQATTTYNPGNVGNTGTSTSNLGNWQTGVNALAKNLAARYVGNNASGQSTAQPQQQTFQALQQILPSTVSPALRVLSDGTPYLQMSKLSSIPGASVVAGNYAKQYNIAELNDDQVAKAQNIDTLTQKINQMVPLISSTLGSGTGGKISNTASTWWNNIFGTNQNINQLNSYNTAAISAIENIVGGSGSGVRVTGAEIGLAQSLVPNSTDTLEQAQTKLASLQSQINEWRNEYFSGSPLPATFGQVQTSIQSQGGNQPSQVVYQGQTYNVDAQGNMTPSQ